MKSFFLYIALTLVFVVFLMVIRSLKGEVALPLSVCLSVSLMGVALSICIPIIEQINNIATPYSGKHMKVLIKALGIALITSTASDICRDAGESAVASKVELLGKCEILLLSFPILKDLLNLMTEVLTQ